jgi:hypothetical protein
MAFKLNGNPHTGYSAERTRQPDSPEYCSTNSEGEVIV